MSKTQKLMAKQVTIGMPHIVALILSLLAGAVQVVIVGHVIAIPAKWQGFAVVFLVFFAGIGINPLVGHAAYAAIKLPSGMANLVSAGLAALSTAATTLTLSHTATCIALGVLTVMAGLGFQAVSPVATAGAVAPPTPAPEPAPAPPPVAVAAPVAATPVAEVEGHEQGFVAG